MSKVLSRRMFNGPRPTANGTGITAYFSNGGLADSETFKNMFTQYKDVLSSQLAPEKSYEELLAQRMKILGPEDPESARNYALMQLGGKIASTPGGLGVALGAGLPEYASVMQKDEAEQRQLQRAAAGSALDALTQQQNTRQSIGIEAAKTAFSEANLQARENAKLAGESSIAKLKDTYERWKFTQEQNGLNTRSENEINAKYGVLGDKTYAVPDPDSSSGFKIISGRITKEGIVDSSGNLMPKDAFPVDSSFVTSLISSKDAKTSVNVQIKQADGTFGDPIAAVQIGDKIFDAATQEPITQTFRLWDASLNKPQTGESSSYVIQDPNSNYGIREVIGFVDKTTGKPFYTDNGVKIEFDSAKGIKGSMKDVLQTKQEGNSVITTPNFGPYAGKSFRSGLQSGGIDQGAPIPSMSEGAGTSVDQQGVKVTTSKTAPGLGAITGEGVERYFVTKATDTNAVAPYTTFANMTDEQIKDSMQKIDSGESMLRNMESVLKAIPEAVGPLATVKGISTAYLAPFTPKQLSGATEYLKTERARRELDLVRQDIRKAFALNPRYPVGELSVIDDLVERPQEFFSDPKAALARMQELVRSVRNNVEWEKAKLENRPANYIDAIPTGTVNDPFPADKLNYLVELKKQGVNLNGVHYQAVDPKDGKLKNFVYGSGK